MHVADTFPMKMPPGAFIFGALPRWRGSFAGSRPFRFVEEFEKAAPAGWEREFLDLGPLGCLLFY
jgi:hypothetical protein